MADEPQPESVPPAAAVPEDDDDEEEEEEDEEDEEDEEEEDEDDEEEEAEEEEHDEETDALLERAQVVISRVLEQEADPNPRLIHTLATICEDQEARYRICPLPLLLPG
jgi:ABC-type Zn2+ transport system substrate-binding protein/surface adhesin